MTFTITVPSNPVFKIFLDTGNTEEISSRYSTGLIDGVTTNPTLILKSGRSQHQVISEIAEKYPSMQSISAEVVADDYESMVKQGLDYYTIAKNVTVKLPCTPEGLKACAFFNDVGNTDGMKVTTNVTLIFSVAQAIMAAKAGATYVSPFVGRVYDNCFDGVQLIQNISNTYKLHGINTKILAASVRDVAQVSRCFSAGANIVTMPPQVFDKMYNHVLTDVGLDTFNRDYQQALNKDL